MFQTLYSIVSAIHFAHNVKHKGMTLNTTPRREPDILSVIRLANSGDLVAGGPTDFFG
jgi:hypothetical protein